MNDQSDTWKSQTQPKRKIVVQSVGRDKVSPYLLPPFAPHPINSVTTRTTNYHPEKLPPVQPLYTPFENKPYQPPRVDQTYVDRIAYYDRQDREYKRELTEKYRREHPLNCYKEDFFAKARENIAMAKRIQFEKTFGYARKAQKA